MALAATLRGAPALELREAVATKIAADWPSLEAIYKQLHAHPELSFKEEKTAALVAKELRMLGIEVTEKIGNTGVVGVFKNGAGPTVLLRGDMDGLPVKEATGLPWASTDVVKDIQGREHPAMHACGHDLHTTSLIGAARTLVALKEKWSGTVVFMAQPAEEGGGGARAMLVDGLFTRFPKPDYALALHVFSDRPAGVIDYTEGPTMAGSRAVDILVRGVGGHGSTPHAAKDPVVLAAQIVLGLQTIVSRELKPGTPAVLTVGTIQGGTRRNIISEDVKLEVTLRSYDEGVADQLVAAIKRICAGMAQAAGMPDDRMPVVTVLPDGSAVTTNHVALTRRLAGVFEQWFGTDRVGARPPLPGSEDFSELGRTVHRVPICIWRVGAAHPEKFAAAEQAGKSLALNHSPTALFLHDPTLRVCITSLSAAVLDLLAKPPAP